MTQGDTQTHGERLARIEEQLKTLFRKQDELQDSIRDLQRELKESLVNLTAALPCKSHATKLTALDRQVYASTKIAAALVAIGGIVITGIEIALNVFKGGKP